MRDTSLTPTRSLVYGGLAAAVTAVLWVMLLNGLGTPPRFTERLTAARETIARADRASRRRMGGDVSPGAICTGPLVGASNRMRATVAAAAQGAKLAVNALDVAPETPSRLGETLAPIRVRFQVQGSYEGAVALLDVLSRTEPVLFADTLDLTSKTSSVTMSFSGRVYCAG